jgi:excisionase family DNA binding protein
MAAEAPAPTRLVVDAHKLAELLDLPNAKSVYRLVELGEIPARRLGGRLRFSVEEVLAALEPLDR